MPRMLERDFIKEDDSQIYERCKRAHGELCVSCLKGIELDDMIAEAKKNWENLVLRKQELHTEMNISHDLITRRLPPEISTSIFFFSISDDKPPSMLDKKVPHSAKGLTITTPLTLGAVCGAWRSIVWGSPTLWTNVAIPVKPWTSPDYDYLDIADDWLERSGQLPLSLLLYAPPSRFGTINDFDADLLCFVSELMTVYLPRCWRFEISCPVGYFPAMHGDAPMLQEIKIACNNRKEDNTVIDFGSTKSKGVRLSVTNYHLKSLNLPFGNLAEFEGFVTLKECIFTFEKASNLQACRILGLRTSRPLDLGPLITHDRLKKLVLQSFRHPSSFLLEKLALPSLTHLSATYIRPSSVNNFVLRSCCRLIYLRLENLPCADGELCTMLKTIHTLQELHLVDDKTSSFHADTLFKRLAQTAVTTKRTDLKHTDSFLPNLSVFTIKFSDITGFSWRLAAGIFGTLDEIRDPVRRPIKVFHIIYDCPRLNETVSSLNKVVTRRFLDLVREGIDVNLYDASAKSDILMQSIAHHNIPVPEWYKTNVQEYVRIADLEDFEIGSDYSYEEVPFSTDEIFFGHDSDGIDEESEDDSEDDYEGAFGFEIDQGSQADSDF